MISAISWVPKGIAKVITAEVEPPAKEEINEILKSGTLDRRGDSDNEDNEEMVVDAAAKGVADEVSQALAAAEVKQPRSSTSFGTLKKCMLVDAAKGASDEVSQALAAAEALGIEQPRNSTSFGTKDMTDARKELNMENYD
ncbi:hypothetical protein MKX01_007521 [Papaver californicum]|nr:hypothetical protein MKX01_007521 [Papaver californicum]